MPVSDQIRDAINPWLSQYKRTSIDAMSARVADIRFNIVKHLVSLYDAKKIGDLPLQTQLDIAKALGLTVPGPVEKMDSVKPSAPYTPGPRQAEAERPVITSEGLVKFEFPGHAASNGMIDPDFTAARDRLNAKREEMKQARLDRYAEELRADARGDLFTIVAAYKPDSVFLIIYQGFMDDDWHEAFLSQHTDAHMHLDRTTAIADVGGFSKMRGEVVRQHTGTFKGDVTVRVILKKTT